MIVQRIYAPDPDRMEAALWLLVSRPQAEDRVAEPAPQPEPEPAREPTREERPTKPAA